MRITQGVRILLVCFLLTATTKVHSLQCYKCTYNKLSTGISLLDSVIQKITGKIHSDNACQLKEQGDLHKILSATCPPATSGKENRCVAVKGEITFTVLSFAVKYETLTRDCVEVDKNSQQALSNNKCFQEGMSGSAVTRIIDDFFKDLDVSDFSGQSCYFEKPLGTELTPLGTADPKLLSNLQCYACSKNTIRTGQEIVDKIINFVAGVVNDKFCGLADDQDKYKVPSKTCPSPSAQDKITRCVAVKGDVTFIVAGISVGYETLTRDCVEVEKASAIQGCQPLQRSAGIFQSVMDDYFEGVQISDFRGNGCYEGNQAEISGQGHILASSTVITAAIAMLLL